MLPRGSLAVTMLTTKAPAYSCRGPDQIWPLGQSVTLVIRAAATRHATIEEAGAPVILFCAFAAHTAAVAVAVAFHPLQELILNRDRRVRSNPDRRCPLWTHPPSGPRRPTPAHNRLS